MAKKKELSVQLRDAYDISYRAPVDDSSDEVVDARKSLRRLKPRLKKKLVDISEICQAASTVNHTIKTRACSIQSVVETDYLQLLKELDRIRRRKSTSATSSTAQPSKNLVPVKQMTYAKAVKVLLKHKVIKSADDVMKRGNTTGGFLLGRL
jgi:hypothetical protein